MSVAQWRSRQHHGRTWLWSPTTSPGAQAKGDTAIFLAGLPGSVRLLHIFPGCTLGQFQELVGHVSVVAVSGCYFMVGHKVWSEQKRAKREQRRAKRMKEGQRGREEK